jgi:chitinase
MAPRFAAWALAFACTATAAAPPTFLHGPYKDVSLHAADGSAMAVEIDARRVTLPGKLLPRGSTLSWAFAIGDCGHETWLGRDADAFARANVPAFAKAGVPYIVSTGGETGVFTCDSAAGMARFVARYDSPMLRGFDFDIEGAQTPAQVDALVKQVAKARALRPDLRWSFTVATWAASDGSRRSLNPLGETVLGAMRRHGLHDAVINLMVMNYGPAQPDTCVVREGRCDMQASALQAARNVNERYGVPLKRIALTAMIGVNNVAENLTSLADVQAIARDARRMGLAGVHLWSLDRDRPCPGGATALSPTCHSLPAPEPLAFTRALAAPQ